MDLIKQKLKLKISERRQENSFGEINIEKGSTKTFKVNMGMLFKIILNEFYTDETFISVSYLQSKKCLFMHT